MNEFESKWIGFECKVRVETRVLAIVSEFKRKITKVAESKLAEAQSKHGRIQDGCHHQVESEWMSEGFFFVQIVAESKIVASVNIAAIIKLESKLRWSEVYFCEKIQDGRIQYGCHHQVESGWMTLSQIELVGVRVLRKMEWESKMAVNLNIAAIIKLSQNPMMWSLFLWIQDGRIQYDCHHQVKWEWMSLSQIELVWVRVRIEWECFWVNLREDNKVSESKMAEAQSDMEGFMMAAIIKLSQNEQVKFFCGK